MTLRFQDGPAVWLSRLTDCGFVIVVARCSCHLYECFVFDAEQTTLCIPANVLQA